MRNLWKSAVAIVAICGSLSAGLAGGSTVKARDAASGPTVTDAAVISCSSSCTTKTVALRWLPFQATLGNPVVRYSVLPESPCPHFPPAIQNIMARYSVFCGLSVGADQTFASFTVDAFTIVYPPTQELIVSYDGWTGHAILVAELADGSKATTAFSTPTGAALLVPSKVTYSVPADGKVVVTWSNPAQTTMDFGQTQATISGHTVYLGGGGQVCKAGIVGTCTFGGLDTNLSLKALVCTESTIPLLAPCVTSTTFWPKFAPQLSAKLPTVIASGVSSFQVTGGIANAELTASVDGKVQSYLALNDAGQCIASFGLSNFGRHSLTLEAAGQRVTSNVWVLQVSPPKTVSHGKVFSLSIARAQPKMSVTLTTSSGEKATGVTNASGKLSFSVKTNVRRATQANLTIRLSIGGAALAPILVRVV